MSRRQLLKVADVAERLQKNPKDVRRLIRQGDLPAINVGTDRRHDYRISEEQYEAFLAARRTSAA